MHFSHLHRIGFRVLRSSGRTQVLDHKGRPISNPSSSIDAQRLDKLDGRLANLTYMSHAIDAWDGVPEEQREDAEPGGQEQFDHLRTPCSWNEDGHQAALYLAARRAERDGTVEQLRAAIMILLAVDLNEMDPDAALSILFPQGAPDIALPALKAA